MAALNHPPTSSGIPGATSTPSQTPLPTPSPLTITTTITTPTTVDLQNTLETGIWYRMAIWPDLCTAVTNGWGGPSSSDKRDWFAGAISDLFSDANVSDTSTQQVQDLQADVEDRLLQIMQDEFDVNVEDESEVEVAGDIVRCWTRVMQLRDVSVVENFRVRYERFAASGAGGAGMHARVDVVEVDQDVDDEDGEDGGSDADVAMGDAPITEPRAAPVQRERQEPIVDEDGFTTVVSKKKR